MTCSACGTDNREGAHFCRECGAPLAESPEASSQLEAAETMAPDQPLPGGDEGAGALVEEVETATGSEGLSARVEAAAAAVDAGAALQYGPEVVGTIEAALAQTSEDLLAAADDPLIAPNAPLETGPAEASLAAPEPAVEGHDEAEPLHRAVAALDETGDEVKPVDGAPPALDETADDVEAVNGPVPDPAEMEDEVEPVHGAAPVPDEGEDEAQPAIEVLPATGATGEELPEPLPPVPPGTLLIERYLVIEALDVKEDRILYRARDLQLCWQCGFGDNSSDDLFCAQCGASLARKQDVQLLQVGSLIPEEVGVEGEAELFSGAGRSFLVLAAAEEEADETDEAPQNLRLVVGQSTDEGQVRELNEDSQVSMLLSPVFESQTRPVLGIFAVADGMGGHEGGEIASKLALQVLVGELLRTIVASELGGSPAGEKELAGRLAAATSAANDAVYLARQKRGNDMGTTLTAALVRDDRLVLAHVGDCRAYRWSAGGLEQLTTDHSLVATLVERGEAAPDEVYTHPHRSVILRCVGDLPVVDVDTDVVALASGERFILCSDGLWEMVRNAGIEDAMMQEADPQAACDLLVRRANLAGGEDNITVIIVQVEAF